MRFWRGGLSSGSRKPKGFGKPKGSGKPKGLFKPKGGKNMFKQLLAFSVIVCLLHAGCQPAKPGQEGAAGGEETDPGAARVTFHIMSKCPYGARVVAAAVPAVKKLGGAVDFNLEYIGRIQGDKLTSMHGDKEVEGNLIQICAHKHGSKTQWLDFLECVNKTWTKIPEGWEACAQEAKIPVEKIKTCKDGEEGKQLLKASYEASQKAGARGSPTIFVNGEKYAGGRETESFGRAFCNGYTGKARPEYCASVPEPIKVPITIIKDDRCKGPRCYNPRVQGFLKNLFEGAEIKELDYGQPEGKELFDKVEGKYLPLVVFGKECTKVEAGYNRLSRRMEQKGDVYTLSMGTWDPKSEICDNGKDDTGNGKVDCDDDTCKGNKVCRSEKAGRLDVFVMSQCPFGVKVLDAMKPVLENFKRDNKKMDFQVQFIGDERDGKLTSMHGQGEVDENIRQICAQAHYPRNYQFMDYIWCRNKNIRSAEWESCAKEAKIDPAVIKKCFEGGEGNKLLSTSYKMAKDLEIHGSPNWLLNNRFEMRGRSPEAIKKAFCEKNDLPECKNELSDKTDVPQGGC